jgi:phosphoglycolate phosphatase-like HAD superfamily hydrolase
MTVAIPDIKGFCYDFDGVFYSINAIGDFYSACDDIMAKVAVDLLGGQITPQDAIKIGRKGYEEDGSNIPSFCRWAEQQGRNPDDFRDQLFRAFNANYSAFLLGRHPNLFINRVDLQEAFKLSHGKVVNGVATHGHAEVLPKQLLETMGIANYFLMQAIHGLNEADYTLKHTDPRLVEMAFRSLGVDPSEGCFVEDTARNLKAMKERNPNTRCTLIHHGRPLEQKPSYIDDQFADILEMQKAYYECSSSERKVIYTLG